MASLLREVCGDHYSLPNNELQEIGEEIEKTGKTNGMMWLSHFPFTGDFSMRFVFMRLVVLVSLCCFTAQASAVEPLKVLLVVGGCCHDYDSQAKLLKTGIEDTINSTVEVIYNSDTSTETRFEIYESEDWASGFDVVVHNECSANVTDKPYVDRILKAHRNGIPAVNLHCAMHSYRWGNFREPVADGADNGNWYEMIGLQSTGHGPRGPIDVTYADHVITNGLAPWTTPEEELYNNVRVYDSATIVASGRQMQMPKKKKNQPANPDAKPTEANAIVAWINEYGPKKTRIFSTSIGHHNDTFSDDRYLDFICRGILWSTHKLTESGKPAAGYGK